MERGLTGGLNYEMDFPTRQVANQVQYQNPQAANVRGIEEEIDYPEDRLAVRENLTKDYYTQMGLIRNYAKAMAKQGIDVFEPDFAADDGMGAPYNQLLRMQASLYHTANALKNERESEVRMAEAIAKGDTRLKPNVNPASDMWATNPNSFYPTQLTPGAEEANRRLGQETNTPQDQQRLNQVMSFESQRIDQQVQQGLISPEYGEYLKTQLVPNVWRQQVYAPRNDDGFGGATAGMTAYVKKMAEVTNGLGFESGKTYDKNGNRIDVARPSEFVGRQLGFTPEGKKFVVDHFQKVVSPDGKDFTVVAVDADGNTSPLDKNNIVGPLRNFIETNEGAGALKDFNRFMGTQGFNTAVNSVMSDIYSKRGGTNEQVEVAPKVQKIRKDINDSLDYLTESGVGRILQNALSVGLKMPTLGDFRPTELNYQTGDGKKIVIKKSGDNYTFQNYKDFFPQPEKKGFIEVNGQMYPLEGTFKNVDKEAIMELLEQFDVINVKLKDSAGKEIKLPNAKQTNTKPANNSTELSDDDF